VKHCQETLTKNWLQSVCFVKKPLQEPFYHGNSPILSRDCM
jgi:hypothetical protein